MVSDFMLVKKFRLWREMGVNGGYYKKGVDETKHRGVRTGESKINGDSRGIKDPSRIKKWNKLRNPDRNIR